MSNIPGVCVSPDKETQKYVFNHTMLRIKDPKASLDFYTRVLGMKLVRKLDFAEWKFSLYFLAYVPEGTDVPTENEANARYAFGREAVLELTHNWGTEEQETTPYHNGNTEPRGFGHICISVPDIQQACARFESLGVNFQKRLGEGGMKNIAFVKDPDQYWIEVVQPGLL
ncbi:lactoylglutathione lyase [Bdellovibrio bacteriovorus]|uniref:Lactoylglutathione lyase n=1 Tax=Bdellovibrio bacteriovorus (strain ATCC 15356 / DSM 50701 / NCIMB 9529 / HD100) TaxID=264462 RepID=Q6MJD2_BDEBA|nr:lactoylglutathione lyase [Bdellovibrio bacteriovorus]AHZ85337.1 lactoylglutathione lyase [Bdellovibrio bacteriovorus]BEV69231.1 Lactoylglutathione lyase [Bdellovibrio bacteriovorus]CAE80629.1 lactoylglutathione lyase [Bdellovibrio bacteriovorus HD100]